MEVTQEWHWLVMESCQEALGRERKASSAPDKDNLFPFSCKNFHLIYHSCKVWGSVTIFPPYGCPIVPSQFIGKAVYSIELTLYLCQKPAGHSCLGLFMNSLQFDWSKCRSLHHDHSLGYYRNPAGLNIAWKNSFYVILLQDCSSYSSACVFPYTFENV